jgi:hypothetical protein
MGLGCQYFIVPTVADRADHSAPGSKDSMSGTLQTSQNSTFEPDHEFLQDLLVLIPLFKLMSRIGSDELMMLL